MPRLPPALVVAATLLLAAGGSAPAAAAPPQFLGQTAVDETTGSCGHCTLVQFGNGPGTFSYVIPSSGVLTKVQVFVGADVDAGDWVQARTFRTSGTPNARVISQGAEHSLAGSARGARTFFDRVPATAGDVLGGRFHVLSRVDATPVEFPTASAADVAGVSYLLPGLDPEVGDPFAVETPVPTNYRVNMFALLESDADADGYGDTSQDLCPGTAAVATGACSGALFGSRLQGPHTGGGSCGYACMRIQKTVAGASTAAAVDGVVVRWRVQAAAAGTYRVRVVAPAGGATYTVLRSSAAETVTADPSPLKQAISTFPTRLRIPAGGYLALVPPPFAVQRGVFPALGATYGQLNDVADGMVTSQGAPINGELFYDADVEPDADGDGYGDVTQDACPSVAATQGACPPRPPPVATPTPTPAPVPPGGGGQATTPVISDLAATHARFRVKRGGAVAARAHAGTRIRLRLSEPASVAFAMQRRAACRPARAGCARWRFVHAFDRSLAAGPSSFAYSGRYRRGATVRRLAPGRHRLTSVATSAAGRTGVPRRIRLTVRP